MNRCIVWKQLTHLYVSGRLWCNLIMCKENVMCEEYPHRSPSSVKYFLSPASREISLKLQNLDYFSAVERRKWKSNTYKPDISLLTVTRLKEKA